MPLHDIGSSAPGIVTLFDQTLGSDAAIIDTGATGGVLPIDYSALEILVYARSSVAAASDNAFLLFNNDTGSNYDRVRLRNINGTVTGASQNAAANLVFTIPADSDTASVFSVSRFVIHAYGQTTGFKAVDFSGGVPDETAANTIVDLMQCQWRSTAAITRVSVNASSGNNLRAGSRMTIYARR